MRCFRECFQVTKGLQHEEYNPCQMFLPVVSLMAAIEQAGATSIPTPDLLLEPDIGEAKYCREFGADVNLRLRCILRYSPVANRYRNVYQFRTVEIQWDHYQHGGPVAHITSVGGDPELNDFQVSRNSSRHSRFTEAGQFRHNHTTMGVAETAQRVLLLIQSSQSFEVEDSRR